MNVLVFGPDRAGRTRLYEVLEERGHEVILTDDVTAARQLFDRHRHDLVFLGGIAGEGLDLVKYVRRLEGERTVVICFLPDAASAAAAGVLEANVDDTIVGARNRRDINVKIALAERRAQRRQRWYALESELRESDARHRLLAEHSTDMISRHDAEGRYLYASPACTRLLGYQPEELVGKSAYDFFHPEDIPEVRESHEDILEQPIVNCVSYRIRKKDGTYTWFETTSQTIRNEATGQIESIIAVSRDTAARRAVEQDVQRCRRELAVTQRLAHIGTWYWDLEDNRVAWSDEVYRIFGVERSAQPSFEQSVALVHPEDRRMVRDRLEGARKGHRPLHDYFRIIRPDGEIRTVFGRGEVETKPSGGQCLVGTIQDFTELVSAEETLREREAQYRAILETTVDGVITIDEEGFIESFNQSAERIFGYDPDEIIGKNIKLLMPEQYSVEHDGYLRSYLETGHRKIIGIGREVLGRRKDGTTFPMDLAVSEVHLNDRRIFSGIVRDVSERRHLEQQILKISEQERQRIGQDLHDGLGQMLTGIGLIGRSLANRLRHKGMEEFTEVEEITELIGEADEFARSLARGLIPVELDAGGLSSAFQRLATNANKLFGIECTFEEIGGKPAIENTIATHLYRIAQEGLSNAVRHGHASQVKIILVNGEGQLRLRLHDNGRGFDGEPDIHHPGMGIRIMRYRARIIGANLDIRGRAEGGTVIVCTLPVEQSPQPKKRRKTGTRA